jgi:hypothetical protein
MIYNDARQFPATRLQQEALSTATRENTMAATEVLHKRVRYFIKDNGEACIGQIIEHQRKKWLVRSSDWLEGPRKGTVRPARIICLDLWPFGPSRNHQDVDVVATDPLNRNIVEGLLPSKDPLVIEAPDIVLNEDDVFGK